jgi:hypothetical protein
MISYEGFSEARAKRATEERAIAAKENGRKRKSFASEVANGADE